MMALMMMMVLGIKMTMAMRMLVCLLANDPLFNLSFSSGIADHLTRNKNMDI